VKRRNRYEIKAEMLEFCREPHTATEILFHVGLFGGFYAKYLKELVEKGLVKVEGERPKKYITTEKGLLWLSTFKQLKKIEEVADLSSLNDAIKP
jgi:predicted transcriptional regulator